MEFFIRFSQHRNYWVLLLILGIAFEVIALYYQYVLDEWPCVLCIQIRIWVFGFILIALSGALFADHSWFNRVLHLLNSIIMIGLPGVRTLYHIGRLRQYA